MSLAINRGGGRTLSKYPTLPLIISMRGGPMGLISRRRWVMRIVRWMVLLPVLMMCFHTSSDGNWCVKSEDLLDFILLWLLFDFNCPIRKASRLVQLHYVGSDRLAACLSPPIVQPSSNPLYMSSSSSIQSGPLKLYCFLNQRTRCGQSVVPGK